MRLLPTAIIAFRLFQQASTVKANLCDEQDQSPVLSNCGFPEESSTPHHRDLEVAKRAATKWELQDDYSGDCFFDGYVVNNKEGKGIQADLRLQDSTFSMRRTLLTDVSVD